MDLLDLLLDHDHWATARLLEVSGGLTDAQLDREFDIGHRTLRATFGHMIFNVPFWTAFLAGQPADGGHSADAQPDDRSLAALSDRHERSYAAFAAEHRTEVLHILDRLGVPDLPEVDLGVWDHMLHNT